METKENATVRCDTLEVESGLYLKNDKYMAFPPFQFLSAVKGEVFINCFICGVTKAFGRGLAYADI